MRSIGLISVLTACLAVSVSCGSHPIDWSPTAPSSSVSAAMASTEPKSDTAPEPLGAAVSTLSGFNTVLVAVGDMVQCGTIENTRAVAGLVEFLLRDGGTLLLLGDLSNDGAQNKRQQYSDCFDPVWGRFPDMHQVSGNHDDFENNVGNLRDGAAYYEHFGAQAFPPFGFQSFDAGYWHLVGLNSEIIRKDQREQVQLAWLKDDLAANANKPCTLAFFHRPLFSSGDNAAGRMQRLWEPLYRAGADVILNGHEHVYERFGLQDPLGRLDEKTGIRQFTVGTGGARLFRLNREALNREYAKQGEFGALKMNLRPDAYNWEFWTVQRQILDSGTGQCHGRPSA